jgi:hypothetical protein
MLIEVPLIYAFSLTTAEAIGRWKVQHRAGGYDARRVDTGE